MVRKIISETEKKERFTLELSKNERETIIVYNDGSDTAAVYTHNKALRSKLERIAAERPESCRLDRISRDGMAVDYSVPKGWVRITPSRIPSDAQRAALKRAREKQSQNAK